MNCREQGSHARGVHHAEDKDEAGGRNRHKNNSKMLSRNLEESPVGTKGKSPKHALNRAKVLTLMYSPWRGGPPPAIDKTKVTNITYAIV